MASSTPPSESAHVATGSLSTDPAYSLDLLQLLASFMIGTEEEFCQSREYRFGVALEAEIPRVFSGGPEARAFWAGFRFHEGLCCQLAWNPLLGRADIAPRVIAGLASWLGKDLPAEFTCAEDGELLDSPDKLLYARFAGPSMVYHAIRMPLLRICEFQTVAATYAAFPDRARALLRVRTGDSSALMLEQRDEHGIAWNITMWNYDLPAASVSRLMTATHAAWLLKARRVARRLPGIPRTGVGHWDIDGSALARLAVPGGVDAPGVVHVPSPVVRASPLAELLVLAGSRSFGAAAPRDGQGVLLDRQYQSLLPDAPPAAPPHYAPAAGDNTYCARETRVPIRRARNFSELVDAVRSVSARDPHSGLLYRGQTNHFSVRRPPGELERLYGSPHARELSLGSCATRSGFSYDRFHAPFQLYLQGLLYHDLPLERLEPQRDERLRTTDPFLDHEVNRRYRAWRFWFGESIWDIAVMGLAQHYGIPTYGLDLTSNLETAAWFALHRSFTHDRWGEPAEWYKPAPFDASNPPVVYVVEVCQGLRRDIDEALRVVSLPPAVRVARQSAYLHFGGWALQANACAEDVRLAVVLDGGFTLPEPIHASRLFPDASEDPFYARMLEMSERARALGEEIDGFQRVTRYLNPLDVDLYEATNRADFVTARRLLAAGAGVRFRDRGGGAGGGHATNAGLTALHWSAFHGDAEFVESLLERGADIEAADAMGRRALVCAAMRGHAAVVGLLLRRGADRSALQYAGWQTMPPRARSAEVLSTLRQHAITDRKETPMSPTVDANELWAGFQEATDRGDQHLDAGRVHEALACYQPVADALRDLLDAQVQGPPGGVPLTLRTVLGTMDLAVPLSRIALAHEGAGNPEQAILSWKELEQRLNHALPMAGGDTRSELESRLADVRGHIRRLTHPGLLRRLFAVVRPRSSSPQHRT